MDFWQRARVFAEETAKRSQEISKEFVSETAKKSKELAAEASKRADQIKIEAMKRADQIKNFAGEIDIPLPPISPLAPPPEGSAPTEAMKVDFERFGVTDELREFVKGITISTFRDFPIEDERDTSEVPTVSNVRQDLNEWQTKHATLVLSSVKEISKFRYELCPRNMKERKFWQIYFILVNNFVAPYEKQYMDNLKVESVEEKPNDKPKESSSAAPNPAFKTKGSNLQSKTSTAEHDLDAFLLGDLGSSDEGPDDDDDGFDDDFDKIENNSGMESDDDTSKRSK